MVDPGKAIRQVIMFCYHISEIIIPDFQIFYCGIRCRTRSCTRKSPRNPGFDPGFAAMKEDMQ
jgi:hypothetical protein